ncbi:MFS transporter [Rhodoferax koreense]|uniref:MFS transporter n=1 Tax=Rhodoferax koreensis TaxID=1842727 RepID=A0A1P8JQ19_9BURK|nr:YbfB/YjiJ family MFS transporter [Rhodoferax koreense]APW35838.1 MFS transporter [Rhodoferax koreense]
MADSTSARAPGRWRIAMAGMVALAVAMGIGRFAFTPLLPMMLHDGVIDLPAASWLASANYLGYMVGAVWCTFQPLVWRQFRRLPPVVASHMLHAGLMATCLLTLGMALQLPALWPLARFLAGVASAFVFVYTSSWCLAALARLGVPAMGGFIYVGPGAGIVLSGLLAGAMVAWDWRAASAWLVFGALAVTLTALVWRVFRAPAAPATPAASASAAGPAAAAPGAPPAPAELAGQLTLLTVAYGIAGFGYIITATFLPVIARDALPGSPWIQLFWPLFGLGVMLGAMLATRVPAHADMRLWLAGCYVLQTLGVLASVVSPSLAGFALGSFMLGLPFTAITFFAMQEVRRLRPVAPAATMGLLTAVYGLGQIVGPLLVAWVLRQADTRGAGFTLSLEMAAASLAVGAGLFGWMVRRNPLPRA